MKLFDVEPGTARIGWIGTGVMGRSMCGHLLQAGFETTVFTRTRSKAEPLLDAGAAWADSPKEVAERSDIVFGIVGFPDDVREVYLSEQGVLAGLASGRIVVDMTTSRPELAVEIARRAAERDIYAIDAPVSGGDVGAREARLSIMIGGDASAVETARPYFERMGKTVVHQGPAGAGQHAKIVNQTVIAGTMIGVCEGLLYAYRAGLDLKTVLASIGAGAAGSWTLSNLAPRIVAGDFEPGFFVEHFVKDLGIALDEARGMDLALPGLALVDQLYRALKAQGHGRKGTQALILALARLSDVSLEKSGVVGD